MKTDSDSFRRAATVMALAAACTIAAAGAALADSAAPPVPSAAGGTAGDRPAVLGGQLSHADDVIVEAQDPDPEGKGTAGDPLQFLWRERMGKIKERENTPPPEGEDSKNPVLDTDKRPGARYEYEDSNARLWRSGSATVTRKEAEGWERGKAGDYETHRGAAGNSDGDPGRAGEDDYRRGGAGYRGED
ncbi:MAG TPA: hypothetical protein VEL28_01805 [Candidatus Binatia bacterium]|nr:hypothetical protein [Candidatus Binatia bacterium]